MEQYFCYNCGKRVDVRCKYCGNCGTYNVNYLTNVNVNPTSKSSTLLFSLAAANFGFFLSVVGPFTILMIIFGGFLEKESFYSMVQMFGTYSITSVVSLVMFSINEVRKGKLVKTAIIATGLSFVISFIVLCPAVVKAIFNY